MGQCGHSTTPCLDLLERPGYRQPREIFPGLPCMTTTVPSAPRVAGLGVPAQVPPGAVSPHELLPQFFDTLTAALGPMHWWPAKTPFEVIVGAILTQNTAWINVERAIANLRRERMLPPPPIETALAGKLARLVRSSGYFRQKAKKLKAFVRFLRQDFGGSLKRMFRTPTAELRERLLALHGIRPGTADSILLFAPSHPPFLFGGLTQPILLPPWVGGEEAGYEKI